MSCPEQNARQTCAQLAATGIMQSDPDQAARQTAARLGLSPEDGEAVRQAVVRGELSFTEAQALTGQNYGLLAEESARMKAYLSEAMNTGHVPSERELARAVTGKSLEKLRQNKTALDDLRYEYVYWLVDAYANGDIGEDTFRRYIPGGKVATPAQKSTTG